MKEWEMENQNRIIFHSHDKVLVKGCVQHHQECWKRICVVFHGH